MSETPAEKRDYKKTLNLPKTPFPMKANLVQNEPASLKRWEKLRVYERLREVRKGGAGGAFVFHDGPPYANGDIHLGHLLNKVLKDLVVRSRSVLGEDCPFTPGWDCHGLPIEHKVMQELGEKAKAMEPIAIRRKCKSYAEKFVKLQSKQMQRLLTMADYKDPYLTMLPRYEAGVLEVFAGLVERGLVYRDLKPVHWSLENQTALAEAELEYYDKEDTSIYVRFDVVGGAEVVGGVDAVMIWTTTPWTLPANLAVAVHPRAEYGVYELDGKRVVLAVELAGKVFGQRGLDAGAPSKVCKGADLVGVRYQHPFVDMSPVEGDAVYSVLSAEYVTMEDGTGLVHTAPGHGAEDYQTGLREGLPVYCPVQGGGTYDDTVPDWLRGQHVFEANAAVVDRLRESGHLFHDERFMHSYPHDWRGKTPVIFRATEQWFVGVDLKAHHGDTEGPEQEETLRERALSVTAESVDFVPEWGRNRMRGMLEGRPDWCVSRQRSWGVPIPAFYREDGSALLNAESVRAVGAVFGEKGSDAWFYMSPGELLAGYEEAGLDKSTLTKGRDTFDVWFESGSSWQAVLRGGWSEKQASGATEGLADLYLEGSDQHRGWFQHSLLPALANTGRPPFKTVVTHGFMVDRQGKKLSKSGGNAIAVEELLKDYGADVCRWWVASLNPENDIKADGELFKLAGEAYRKVRNTLRFLLGNLADFEAWGPNAPEWAGAFEAMTPMTLEAWLLGEYNRTAAEVVTGYKSFQFRRSAQALYAFCNETLSAVYLAAVKDRLYCDSPDAPRRRRAQAAMHMVTSGLCGMLAPILPHTADEAARAKNTGDPDYCVHLETLIRRFDHPVSASWVAVMEQREDWLRVLEQQRQAQGVDNPLDCGLRVPDGGGLLAGFDPLDLADLCGVSRFAVDGSLSEPAMDDLRDQPRCERSWKRDGTVKERGDGGMLSERDAAAVGVA
ncbi:MAG: isoleucine--tRNA ligase [Planctomycetota bacterium]